MPDSRRALLAVDHPRNAELLAAWLQREQRFVVTRELAGGVDIVILDLAALRRLGLELRRARDRAYPAWLPVLLILPRSSQAGRRTIATSLWEIADEVLVAPVRSHDLSVRFERLLALRERSLAIARRLGDLGRSNSDLEQFAYVAAHELSTPLSVVTGAVETIAARQGHKLDPHFRRLLDAAIHESERLETLIHDLLAFARVGHSTSVRAVALDDVLADALTTLEGQIAATGADIQSKPLPTVICDARQLSIVLVNLVGNALKYRSDDRPRVAIWPENRGESFVIAIEDNGRGVAAERRSAIFEMFERGDGGRTAGHGIGLALCKRIVEAHRGRIWMEAAPGRGTIVKLELPK